MKKTFKKTRKFSYNERMNYHSSVVDKISGKATKKQSYSLGFIFHNVDIDTRQVLLYCSDASSFVVGEKAGQKAYKNALNTKF